LFHQEEFIWFFLIIRIGPLENDSVLA
jgi:hypothetical protein